MTIEDASDPEELFWENYRPPIPDTSHLITETEEPVDNIFSEKQMRLLTESLYCSWHPGHDFWVAANVGMYEALNAKAVVPDVMLSLDTTPETAREFGSKCYFFWDHGKPPEVVIEIVSNNKGGELTEKKARYEKLHVDHYVVFDPAKTLSGESLQVFSLERGSYQKRNQAEIFTLTRGLGLTLWKGQYEGQEETWLRWYDESSERLIETGSERANAEAKRANAEAKRANAETKRANAETKRANAETKRADDEARRADDQAEKVRALAQKLKELGIDSDDVS